MEEAETEAENIRGALRTSRGPPCAPSRPCPRAHLTHPHLSSALGRSHEGAAGALLNEELREMGDAACWPEWGAGGQGPTRDSESSSAPGGQHGSPQTSNLSVLPSWTCHSMQARGNHMKRNSLCPGWAGLTLFVCFVCCFLFMLFRIKALGWTFFFSGCSGEKYSLQQRSLDQTFGFSERRGYNFSCWQSQAPGGNYQRHIVPPWCPG